MGNLRGPRQSWGREGHRLKGIHHAVHERAKPALSMRLPRNAVRRAAIVLLGTRRAARVHGARGGGLVRGPLRGAKPRHEGSARGKNQESRVNPAQKDNRPSHFALA